MATNRNAIVVGLFLCFLANVAVGAQQHVSRLSVIGGDMRGIAVSGNFAYLGEGSKFVVVDITSPTLPQRIAEVDLPDIVESVDVQGSIACVADGYNHDLIVMDVSDPSKPVQLSERTLLGGGLTVRMFSHYVILCLSADAPVIYDLSDPANPVLVSRIPEDPHDFAMDDVALEGSIACISNEFSPPSKALILYDLTDPSAPRRLSYVEPEGSYLQYGIGAVRLQNHLAYSVSNSEMQIHDISNPSLPTLVASFSPAGSGHLLRRIVPDGNTIYVEDECNGLYSIDVTNPAQPEQIGFRSLPYQSQMTMGGPNVLCACGRYSGLSLLDTASSTPLATVGHLPCVGSPGAVVIAFPYLFTTNFTGGINTVQVGDPEHPILAANYTSDHAYYDLKRKGNLLYAACESQLQILDVSDPLAPSEVALLPLSQYGQFLSLFDNTAFVACSQVLYAVDITTPSQPFVRSEVPINNPLAMAVYSETSGTLQTVVNLYFTDNEGTLYTFDARDPDHLQLLNAIPNIGGRAMGADIEETSGTAHLLVNTYGAVKIFDLADPSAPVLINTEPGGESNDLVVSNDFSYVSIGTQGLMIYDLADPAAPESAGFYNTSGEARALSVRGSVAYQADLLGGLNLLRLSGARIRDAEILRHTIPAEIAAGTTVTAQVVVRNYGQMSWDAATNIALSVIDQGQFTVDGIEAVGIPPGVTVLLEGDYTFNITLHAPAADGEYDLNLQMAQISGNSPEATGYRLSGAPLANEVHLFGQSYPVHLLVTRAPNSTRDWNLYE